MDQNKEFNAGILRRASRALAGYAAAELLEKHPETKAGFEPDPFAQWQDWLTVRVDELAAAIAVDRARVFAAQVLWGKAALQSRGIPPESFRTALECLQTVMERELPEQVGETANEYVSLALEAFGRQPIDLSSLLLPDTPMGRLASKYLLVLLEGDRRRACRLILDALRETEDPRDLYLQVLLPAQEELGRMWLANEINVAEEHFASQTTQMAMSQLLPHTKVKPSNGKTLLAASVAGNQHDIGLQAVADFFEMDGWRTVLLGANVPARDLVQAVDCFDADLLGLSVSQTTQFDAVKATIQALRQAARGDDLKIMIGGRAFIDPDELPKELGADGYAPDPRQAVSLGRKLVGLE